MEECLGLDVIPKGLAFLFLNLSNISRKDPAEIGQGREG